MLSKQSLHRLAGLALGLPILLSQMAVASAQMTLEEGGPGLALGAAGSFHVVTVHANVNQWQHSGIRVAPGQSYSITAKGQWQLAGTCARTGPDGENVYTAACWDLPGNPIPDQSHGMLIGQIGARGTPFAIGGEHRLNALENGILYLTINDVPGHFQDNSGRVVVTIERLRAVPAGSSGVVPRAGGGGRGAN